MVGAAISHVLGPLKYNSVTYAVSCISLESATPLFRPTTIVYYLQGSLRTTLHSCKQCITVSRLRQTFVTLDRIYVIPAEQIEYIKVTYSKVKKVFLIINP